MRVSNGTLQTPEVQAVSVKNTANLRGKVESFSSQYKALALAFAAAISAAGCTDHSIDDVFDDDSAGDDDSALLDDDSAAVDDDSAAIDDDSAVLDDDSSVSDDDSTPNEDCVPLTNSSLHLLMDEINSVADEILSLPSGDPGMGGQCENLCLYWGHWGEVYDALNVLEATYGAMCPDEYLYLYEYCDAAFFNFVDANNYCSDEDYPLTEICEY